MLHRNPFFVQKLKNEFKLSIGCTDPAAIAAAVALASENLKIRDGRLLKKIKVSLSTNIFKNGLFVDIPGITEKGLPLASALGFVMGRSELGFEVFKGLERKHVEQAKALIEEQKVEVVQMDKGSGLTIQVILTTRDETVEVLVKNDYLQVSLIKVNGETIYENTEVNEDAIRHHGYRFRDIVDFTEKAEIEDLQFINDGIQTNKAFTEQGMLHPRGLKLSEALRVEYPDYDSTDDVAVKIKMMTAAGVDARMGGQDMPVMSSAGSGNLGLGATIPLFVVCEHYGFSHDQLLRATAMANLFHIYVKEVTGRLTSVCGGVMVGMGTAVAIVWLLDGTVQQMEAAIKYMSANLTGMICDGANFGCSLKVSTAAVESYYAALYAMNGIVPDSSVGIVDEDIEQTISNVADIYLGMNQLDPAILNMLSGNYTKGIAR